MIIPNEFFRNYLSALFVNYISIDFRDSVIFLSFFMKMVIFFKNLISLREFSLASQLAAQPAFFTPKEKLYILIGIIFKSVINIIIADRRTGTKRNALSVIRSQRIGM